MQFFQVNSVNFQLILKNQNLAVSSSFDERLAGERKKQNIAWNAPFASRWHSRLRCAV